MIDFSILKSHRSAKLPTPHGLCKHCFNEHEKTDCVIRLHIIYQCVICYNDTQDNSLNATISINNTEHYGMLFSLSAVMLNVVLLNVIMLSVLMLNIILFNALMLVSLCKRSLDVLSWRQ